MYHVKVELKTEDDGISTDDELSPECVISSSTGYDPVKSEEADDEDTGEDTNIPNEQHLPIKEESVKTDDVSTDDDNEIEEPERRRKSPRLLSAKPLALFLSHEGCKNYAQKGGVCIKHGASWTKRTCSHEGCTNQAVQGGVCIKHGAKVKTCSHDGCTNQSRKGGLCIRHFRLSIGV